MNSVRESVEVLQTKCVDYHTHEPVREHPRVTMDTADWGLVDAPRAKVHERDAGTPLVQKHVLLPMVTKVQEAMGVHQTSCVGYHIRVQERCHMRADGAAQRSVDAPLVEISSRAAQKHVQVPMVHKAQIAMEMLPIGGAVDHNQKRRPQISLGFMRMSRLITLAERVKLNVPHIQEVRPVLCICDRTDSAAKFATGMEDLLAPVRLQLQQLDLARRYNRGRQGRRLLQEVVDEWAVEVQLSTALAPRPTPAKGFLRR